MTRQPAEVDAALAEWRQGDFALDVQGYTHVADLHTPLTDAAIQLATELAQAGEELGLATVAPADVRGLVVVSQTCDIIRRCSTRPLVELAAVVEIDRGNFGHAKRGRVVRYALIPALEDRRLVADLDRIVTVEKSVVAGWQRQAGCQTDGERRQFAGALARKRARFAFPDEFVTAVKPLSGYLAGNDHDGSPESMMIEALREIRVQAEPHWNADPTTLTLFFIRESDAGVDDNIWQQQADDWCAMVQLPATYGELFPQVIELEDMSAVDYVTSDPVDLG